MASFRMVGIAVLGGAAVACGGPKSGPPASVAPDSLRSVSFKEVSGRVMGADSARPVCPVTPHFDAVIIVSHMQGKLQYRWERSTGVAAPTLDLEVPAAARTGDVDVTVKSDEWASSEPGKQLAVTNRLHVLAPVDKLSPPVDLMLKCY